MTNIFIVFVHRTKAVTHQRDQSIAWMDRDKYIYFVPVYLFHF